MLMKIKKRYVFKGGKIVATREGSFVKKLANKIIGELKPYSKRIQVVGSIRRHSNNPVDVDIVLIPKDKEKIKNFLSKKGKFIQGGDKRATFKIEGVRVELYYTIPEEWGAALLAYSSKKGAGIGLRIVARLKGFKLTQHGLFNRKTGRRIAGKTEEEIYHKLGRPWKKPEKR